MSEAGRRELKRAGLAAARDARAVIAEAIAVLDSEVESSRVGRALAEPLAQAVAMLFRAEVGGPDDVRDRLRDAAVILGAVLDGMHAPEGRTSLDRAGPLVARSLAILHPARAELDRALRPVLGGKAPPRFSVPAASNEKRSARRVLIDAEVGAHSQSHFLSGVVGDVSSGGLFIATDRPLPIGAELTISLVLPDGKRLSVDGVVAWVRTPDLGVEGMGVRFVELSPLDAEIIARWAG